MKTLLLITASHGENLKLVHTIADLVKTDFKIEIIDLTETLLPLYTPLVEENGIPEGVKELTESIKNSDALFIASPEYNGSMAPTLNNMIAWVSIYSNDWREAFNGKIVVIGTHSGGGGAHVLTAMRQQLAFIGCNVLGRTLQTNRSKTLNHNSVKQVFAQVKKLID